MRPIAKTYTPAAASLTGFASNVTGATWTLTATSAADSLGHLVTIRNDSATDHSAKTAILTGTDSDGNAQTETVNLPGTSATITSTKYFLTLTSVVPSATIGGDTMDIGWTADSNSPTIPLEWRSISPASVEIIITGTINVDGQETLQSVFDNYPSTLTWTGITSLTGITATTIKPATVAATGVRVNVNSVTAGATYTLLVNQATQQTG